MPMTEIRDELVFTGVNRLIDRYVSYPPVDVLKIAQAEGARLLSFAEAVDRGMDPDALIECLGNRDGVALEGQHSWVIVYNKNAPVNRLRFTLAEELCHHALGHTRDRSFLWHSQSYSETTYWLYEAEAKRAAALLLIPPSVYYKYRSWHTVRQFARLFAVSEECMQRAAAYYDRNQEVVQSMYSTKNLSPHGLTAGMPTVGLPVPASIWPSGAWLL